jgi:hypothetical protein
MIAKHVPPRPPPRPSEYRVTVTGATHTVCDVSCDQCGEQRVLFPVAMLTLMIGQHLPCPHCFAPSSTRVVRHFDIEGLYDECR